MRHMPFAKLIDFACVRVHVNVNVSLSSCAHTYLLIDKNVHIKWLLNREYFNSHHPFVHAYTHTHTCLSIYLFLYRK